MADFSDLNPTYQSAAGTIDSKSGKVVGASTASVNSTNQPASGAYTAPTLYGPNGQVAAPTQSTSKAQVDAALASGWSTTPVQKSDPNKPSSSATIPLGAQANNATNNATNNNLPDAPTDQENGIMGFTGLNLTDLRGLSAVDKAGLYMQYQQSQDAKSQAEQARLEQNNIYNSELAQQNAQYSQSSNQLTQDRANAKDSAGQQLAALNASGGIGSDSGQFLSHIDAQFDLAGQQLTLQAQQAKAALDAGNFQAYQSIQSNMNQTVAQVRTNVTNLLNSFQASQVAQGQFQQQEEDKNATLYRDTLTQLPLAQADSMAKLPGDWGNLSSKQVESIKGTTAYQQGKQAGLSDQAILGDLKGLSSSGSFAQQRITNQANQATARLAIAQANLADKQASLIDSTTIAGADGGKDFLTAFQQNNSQHTKQENTDFLSSMSSLLQAGNKNAAANALTNYILNPKGNSSFSDAVDSLRIVAGIVGPLKDYIDSLPKDQQAGFLKGNYQTMAAKLGQNPNPKLQQLGSELSHVGVIYARAVGGVRAAASTASGNSIFGQLIPNIKDSKSLAVSDLTGFTDTANDLLNSAISSKIGSDTFKNIYGDGGVIGGKYSPKSSSSTPTPYGSLNGKPVYLHADNKLYPTP